MHGNAPNMPKFFPQSMHRNPGQGKVPGSTCTCIRYRATLQTQTLSCWWFEAQPFATPCNIKPGHGFAAGTLLCARSTAPAAGSSNIDLDRGRPRARHLNFRDSWRSPPLADRQSNINVNSLLHRPAGCYCRDRRRPNLHDNTT